ncbi:MAG: cation:proton antiporter [Candidatus Hadarchaeum sp.]|jgi:Kef-type K+ transport system membrane component KefB|nr:cation:proton antiporter [Candidatus Hadarchaeum sp.]
MPVELSLVLLYLATFLIAAKVGGIFAAKIKQPAVFGELLAGIIIGPSVAGLIAGQLGWAAPIDPISATGEIVGVFGDIGIVLLLFLAGLSIDVDEFKAEGRSSTIVAASGVIMAFILGFVVATIYGWTGMQAAFVGAVLTATSVGITVRTLIDIDRLHTKIGMTILGAAVIDDVFGIVILSILSGLAFGTISALGVVETVALIVLFFTVVIYIGFKAAPKLFTWVSRLPAEEITLAVALALVFLIGALADQVRIATITGAFIAGLILSKTSVVGMLRDKISIIGYGFFIPLFFVEMGVRTDVSALAGAGFLALALVGVSIFDKVAGCGIGALLSGFSFRDSLRIGVGMMPRAEVALVVAAIGIKAGIVTPTLFSITVAIVLFTSLITPIMVKIAFKGAQEERK